MPALPPVASAPPAAAGEELFVFPASYAQRRLWFLHQLDPGSPVYNIARAVRLDGPLAPGALAAALAGVTARHETLRTTLAELDGEAVQVVRPEAGAPALPVVDVSGLGDSARAAEARALASREGRLPFDLARGPLLRSLLLRSRPREHVLLLTIHHAIADGWSMAILVGEISELYRAGAEGAPAGLPELEIQYADYAEWQRSFLAGEVLERQVEHWREALAGAPAVLELPLDHPRPPVREGRGARLPVSLPEDLRTALAERARDHRASLFMVLLAVFQVLLHRWSGETEIVVGSPIANRTRPEIEGLIGYFANTLVLRGSLADDPPFDAFLARVRDHCVEGFAHQDLPFELLVEALRPERHLSHTPLFQAAFAFHTRPAGRKTVAGELRATPVDADPGTAKFDLTLALEERRDGLAGYLEYDTGLFHRTTMERLVRRFRTLAGDLARRPERPISRAALLTTAERHQLLEWGHAAGAPEAGEATVLERFRASAARAPDAVAVSSGDHSLSYGELALRARRVGRALAGLGVGPEVRVGLRLGRGLDLVTAVLGVLEAGGAYLPLDPEQPAERLAFMAGDSGCPVLLCDEAPDEAPAGTRVLSLGDLDDGTDAAEATGAARIVPDVRTTAYVIYTSGSTGRPKGVAVRHREVARLFDATAGWLRAGTDDAWTLFHSYAFDFSVWELWGALAHGGRLVVVPLGSARSPDAFRLLVERERVTVLSQTPSAFRGLVEACCARGAAPRHDLRLVVFGGEALEPESLAPWITAYGDRHPALINMFGITETTVHVTCRPIVAADLRSGVSPVGRPLPHLSLAVLDPAGEPVPIGVAGEIHVGGEGLALGYLGRPGRTAERFVPDPTAAVPGVRRYRSGDLGRHLPDGDLQYLGRMDLQVKVRGFRIEPGEIEAVLERHPAVGEAVVVARRDGGPAARLVAYLRPADGLPTAEELRAFLLAALPDYMVPAAFVPVDRWPLTANGKLDRSALPAPDAGRLASGRTVVAPATPAERTLAEIWSRVLGVDPVGVEDNFFSLGGDSILSIRVRAEAAERGLLFTVQQLFQCQTVRALAAVARAEDEDGEGSGTPAPPLVPEGVLAALPDGVEDAFPLSRLQEGMILHSRLAEDGATYHDVFSYHVELPLDEGALAGAVGDLVSGHAALRTRFDLERDGEPLQLVHRSVPSPLVVHDLAALGREEQEAALDEWLATESRRRLAWDDPPLLRFVVHRRGLETFQLSVSFHHALLDGWSLASLLSELFHRYLVALGRREDPPPPPPRGSYRDFVALERQALSSEAMEAFWAARLDGAEPTRVARWPVGPDGPSRRPPRRLPVPLPPDLSAGLEALADTLGVPLKNVLLAVHLRVLAHLSGQDDVVTGVVFNGRPEVADGERVVGLFLNTLPFRVAIGAGSWRELVEAVFAAETDMLPARRYPLAELQRRHRAESLFEVLFNYVHFHVYRNLGDSGGVRVLGRRDFQRTNYALAAEFGRMPGSGRVALALDCTAPDFSAARVQAIARTYRVALASAAADATGERPVGSLLTAAERHQALVEWNPPERGTREPAIARFERRVRERGRRRALVWHGGEWSYAELDARADRWARYLDGLGVGPEARVGLLLPRAGEAIAAMLGTWKAGAAFVPLDPGQPPERLRAMVRDAGCSVVVAAGGPWQEAGTEEARWVELGEVLTAFDRRPPVERPEPSAPAPESLAYVLFTSGSTGRPKGVAVEHRHLASYLDAAAERLGLGSEWSYGSATTLAADLGHTVVFGALCGGGTLHLLPEDLAGDPGGFGDYVARHRLDCLKLVPTHAEFLLDGPSPGRVMPRRLLVLGGEASFAPLLERLHAAAPGCRVANHYGPTETTVGAAALPRAKADPGGAGAVPLGRPLACSRVHVVDASLQPVAAGVTGELVIGGAGVARGYVGDPRSTAARFVPDPFGGAGGRLYRTGDRGRTTPDGLVEFVGRADRQVKIRGHRVEPGEVEAALRAHPGVRECLVTASRDAAGRTTLAAYVAGRLLEAEAVPELRDHLRRLLPAPMIPTAWVVLRELPRTANGKIDRQALPDPAATAAGSAAGSEEGRNPLRELLAEIWCEVLGVERVEPEDDFFDLGGHSLLANQVVARLREAFGVDLPLRDLFDHPTVEGLAERLAAARREGGGADDPALVPVPRDGDLPLSHAQQRLWFLDRIDPGTGVYNSSTAVELEGPLDHRALAAAVGEVVRRHEVLRTRFPAVGGEPRPVIVPPRPQPLPVCDLTALPVGYQGDEARRLLEREAARPFDLAAGPLFRVRLVRLADGGDGARHALLVTLHHMISDAWSRSVFLREVAAIYRAESRGVEHGLPEPVVQYADYAHWQRRVLAGPRLERLLAYWRRTLADPPPPLDLVGGRRTEPGPAGAGSRGGRYVAALDADLAAAVRRVGRSLSATPFMTLLAGFEAFLHRRTGAEDLLVGCAAANRSHRRTENLIGPFLNLLLLRTHLGGAPGFGETLRRVRETAVGAFAHQELPFERLIEELQPDRRTGETPLFQVAFGLLDLPIRSGDLGDGLHIRPFPIEREAARFDLTLWIRPTADGFGAVWSYRSDLFDSETVSRMHREYVTLLRDALRRPDTALDLLELRDPEEEARRREVLREREDRRRARLLGGPATVRKVRRN